MWWSHENFVQRAMPFGRGEFAPLCASAGFASLRRSLARHQPSGLPRPVPLGRGPRKVFFSTYTPPQKTDFNLFAASEPRTRRDLSRKQKGRPSGFTGGAAFFVYSYFFLARERMTSSVTMHRSIVMSMSGRVLPTMMSTFISRRYSTKPITQMMRLRAS